MARATTPSPQGWLSTIPPTQSAPVSARSSSQRAR